MDGGPVIIQTGNCGSNERGGGEEVACHACLVQQELHKRQVPVPEQGRAFIHHREQIIPVKLEEGGGIVSGVQCPLRADQPGRGIVHPDLRDAHGIRMNDRHLQHLDSVAGEDVTTVAVRLFLVVLARLQEDRGRRDPVRGQGHVTGQEGEPRHRRKVCGGQEHYLRGARGREMIPRLEARMKRRIVSRSSVCGKFCSIWATASLTFMPWKYRAS